MEVLLPVEGRVLLLPPGDPYFGLLPVVVPPGDPYFGLVGLVGDLLEGELYLLPVDGFEPPVDGLVEGELYLLLLLPVDPREEGELYLLLLDPDDRDGELYLEPLLLRLLPPKLLRPPLLLRWANVSSVTTQVIAKRPKNARMRILRHM